ncbi:MAG: hypothetical protein KJO07_14190, partial [Deltaproteobacteria bacterium]|nr:hypothetical protein [Deltaproteobacteria bacterium]
ARFHTLFNLIGVAWMLIAMPFVLDAIPSITGGNPVDNPHDRATALALFHTFFNITNTFGLVWVSNKLVAVVMRLVPKTPDEREGPHLSYLESSLVETPDLAAGEGIRALANMSDVCVRMFDRAKSALLTPDTIKFGSLIDVQSKDEQVTDEMEEEIVRFGTQLSRTDSSTDTANDVTMLLEVVDELENTADHCLSLVEMAAQKRQFGTSFSAEADQELKTMLEQVDQLLHRTVDQLHPDQTADARHELHRDAGELIEKIRTNHRRSRDQHATRMAAAATVSKDEPATVPGSKAMRSSLLFLEILAALRYIAEFMWSVQQAYARRHPDVAE